MSIDLQLTRVADLQYLGELRDLVEQGCREAGLSKEAIFGLKLAVDEVITNIMMHGYKGLAPGQVTVQFRADDEKIVVTISDSGHSFDPRTPSSPDLESDWQEREVGGLGIYFLQKMVDELDYQTRPGPVNHLTMIKYMRDTGTSS